MDVAPTTDLPVPRAAAPARADAAAAHDAFLARRRFSSLDGVRCISIVAVIWHHAGAPIAGVPLSHNGFLGVDMFFVLSGFLIVTLLLREREAAGRISLPDFYARRTLRIFPIYYALLAVLVIRYLFISPENPAAAPFFHDFLFYATYTSNWIGDTASGLAHTWSLATEEQFYFVWPVVERFVPRRFVPLALVAAIGVNQCVNFGVADPWFNGWVGVHRPQLPILQATFTPILLGVALAHLLHNRAAFSAIYRVLGRRWAAPVALLAVALAANVPGDISGLPRLTIQSLMAVFLAACVVRDDHPLRPILTSAPFRATGLVSYGMYLLHFLFLGSTSKLLARFGFDTPLLHFFACLLITFIVSQASFWCFERPFLRLKARFRHGGMAH